MTAEEKKGKICDEYCLAMQEIADNIEEGGAAAVARIIKSSLHTLSVIRRNESHSLEQELFACIGSKPRTYTRQFWVFTKDTRIDPGWQRRRVSMYQVACTVSPGSTEMIGKQCTCLFEEE